MAPRCYGSILGSYPTRIQFNSERGYWRINMKLYELIKFVGAMAYLSVKWVVDYVKIGHDPRRSDLPNGWYSKKKK